MVCIGCDRESEVAAYAIMHVDELAELGVEPAALGPQWPNDPGRRFGAAPVCKRCHDEPLKRRRKLKAHFALPGGVDAALATAGSHGGVQM